MNGLQVSANLDQSILRKLISIYSQRTKRGNTKISSDISLNLPEEGWYVSKDDLDKWMSGRNKLGEKKYAIVKRFLALEKIRKIVPEVNQFLDPKDQVIGVAQSLKCLYANPNTTFENDLSQFSGYWVIENGTELTGLLPFGYKHSFFVVVYTIENYEFALAHIYSAWSRNFTVLGHTSGFLFQTGPKSAVFKGFNRKNRNEIQIDIETSEQFLPEQHLCSLRSINESDFPEDMDQYKPLDWDSEEDEFDNPAHYLPLRAIEAKKFFDKIIWSVLPEWN